MMQNFGLEDLSHIQSRRNPLKYLVRVEMASDWFTRIYRSILAEEINIQKSRYGVQTRLRALLEPAITIASIASLGIHLQYCMCHVWNPGQGIIGHSRKITNGHRRTRNWIILNNYIVSSRFLLCDSWRGRSPRQLSLTEIYACLWFCSYNDRTMQRSQ